MNLTANSNVQHDILNVRKLLCDKSLHIPDYQRPYKWGVANVRQCIQDIKTFKDKTHYRFGTIVLHQNSTTYDIVDGQQRSITLMLIAKALINRTKDYSPKSHTLKKLHELEGKFPEFKFKNPISQRNIRLNYHEIYRQVADFDDQLIEFFLEHCEVVVFKIEELSEAFQFFDSQNARGKDLEPHDLLKAFHLRAYQEQNEVEKFKIIDTWENADDSFMVKLFGEYLFRIKGWCKGESARVFTKNKIYHFKGVNIEERNSFPYAKSLRIVHHFVEEYNNSYHRGVDQQIIAYPFQLDQPIINGKRFFEMTNHYYSIFKEQIQSIQENEQLSASSKNIIDTINSYNGKNRTGDLYVRMLFDTILTYYVDKFGSEDLNSAITYFFIWAYKLRLDYQSLQFSSVDNYVKAHNQFKRIRDAYSPQQLFNRALEGVEKINATKVEGIKKIFVDLNYHNNVK